MRRHRQIITLAVDFDIAKCPPPEQWNWVEIAESLDGFASVEVLATGTVEKLGPPRGFALGMEVLQSDLYKRLPPEVQAECDALIAAGQQRV